VKIEIGCNYYSTFKIFVMQKKSKKDLSIFKNAQIDPSQLKKIKGGGNDAIIITEDIID